MRNNSSVLIITAERCSSHQQYKLSTVNLRITTGQLKDNGHTQ